jgi:hypothetical protein
MARIRTIKPEFWTGEQVMECTPIARLLFIGLWNFCDDAGRHPMTPRQIKALVFPSDDFTVENIQEMLDELSSNGLIKPYVVGGKDYFEVTGWRHQKIDRPQSPKYPAPIADHSPNPRDGKDEGRDEVEEEDQTSETIVSGAEAPTVENVVPIDAKTALFRDGLRTLSAISGRPEGTLRSIIGKWLKLAGDDCAAVHAAINRARDQRVIEPIAWIEKALKPADPDAAIYRGVL